MNPFKEVVPIIQKIEAAGYEAYIVGGSVRDYLLRRPIHDIDIATSAFPHEIKSIFPNTVDVGIEHGTVLVIEKGISYEITTFRTESEYEGYRRPEKVTFVRSLLEDLKRRDFTMNAMAMDISGSIIDPFNGKHDLQQRVIKTVGSPHERFQEDALRMIRAVRFVSQLGFVLAEETQSALKQHAPLLSYISIERISSEIEKLFNGQRKEDSLSLLIKSTINEYLPGLKNRKHIIESMLVYDLSPLNARQMWILLLHFVEGDKRAFMQEWKQPNKKIKYVIKALPFLECRLKKDWTPFQVYNAGESMASDVEAVARIILGLALDQYEAQISASFNSLPIQSVKDLAVTGDDFMNWEDKPGGPWIKEKLERVERAVVEEKIVNDKDSIRRWLYSCNHR
ncbi:CCA tRNA nucleotidyltransferase [Falsibacillus albus]|uniref:CCA-adding enzyme n=1 Tax=Falsibacillus albus TaxID=2478915 RepID=A0A3L7K337_9BACI|nr:CCA tRNA nucleotidyltransferase [Falsibacillus albus]RLQ95122.1 CCA tRNA nucleotidyltransferase [Falsibacillus albus]